MPYKISGSKSHTARIIILKESDWSIESNTVVSGSGNYEIDSLVSGTKTVLSRNIDGWIKGYGLVESVYCAPGTMGIFAGGYDENPALVNTIDYIVISTLSNSSYFGDLTSAKDVLSATSNGTNDRAVFAGDSTQSNVIDYITVSVVGDASDFGDLTLGRQTLAGTSNSTNNRGIFGGGYNSGARLNLIDYITISSIGNAINFGILTQVRQSLGACSNGTNDRGIFAGGHTGAIRTTRIDYVTISSAGNAIDFGDLVGGRSHHTSTSNSTNDRGIFAGGYNSSTVMVNSIDYIIISSTGNTTDFGDLSNSISSSSACSDGIGNRGIFGGGSTDGGFSGIVNIIEYITISSIGNSTDFGDLLSKRLQLTATSNG